MPEWSKGADLRPAVYDAWVQTPLDANLNYIQDYSHTIFLVILFYGGIPKKMKC